MITLRNNTNATFTVLDGTTPVFTGPLAEAMQVYSRMTLASRPAPVVTERKARRLAELDEKKQAGVR